MKSLTILLAWVLSPVILFAQYDKAIPTAQAMSKTFNLYGDKLTGTCFMVTKNENQYFVTAAHLFESSHRSGDEVAIQMVVQNVLQPYHARIYFHSDRKVDVAVLKLSEQITQYAEIPDELMYKDTIQKIFQGNGISTDSLWVAIGMEVYFLGFPLGNLGTEVFGMKVPLLKQAIISGWVNHNGIDLLLLDGHNNLGFSGGPVIAFDQDSKQMRMIAVISGYLPEPVNFRQKNDLVSVEENSGIIVCYYGRYVADIFKQNKLH